MTDASKIKSKFLKTGWQSWSWANSENMSSANIPVFNYSPQSLNSHQEIDIKKIILKKPAKGWCSWYAFGPHISEEIILGQARWLTKRKFKGLKYILIDSGWVSLWGDWLDENKRKFPKGLKQINKDLKVIGFESGIWIAPFLVDPNSKLAKAHPDWLASDKGGFIEGFRLTPFDQYLPYKKYILDISKKAVKNYINKFIDQLLEESGFKLLKLDYLYGLYFNHNLSFSETDTYLKYFLERIKKKYPQVYTIGSGCPLIPAVGLVDSMRIGPDIIIPSAQSLPVVKNIVNKYLYEKVFQCIKSRSWTREFWNIDPDVFLCGESFGYSEKETSKLRDMVLNTNGNVFIGDDMGMLSTEKIEKYIEPLFV